MSRFFSQQISRADLKTKILQAWKKNPDYDKSENIRESSYLKTLTLTIENDLKKINFDCENISAKSGFGNTSLIGLQSLSNGLTFLGVNAGGDWEQPLLFIIYFDGKELRGYIPEDGNPYNTKTKSAYGNDNSDDANAQLRGWQDTQSADFDDGKICLDIINRIQYNGTIVPIKTVAMTQAPKQSQSQRTVKQKTKPKLQPKQPKQVPMAMSPFPMAQNSTASAICSRCGHTFKPEKIIKECPDCGLTVGEEKDGELEWTEEMQEPIPKFVYNAQSPEEIFYKSIRWYYQKWIAKLKGNPSARIR